MRRIICALSLTSALVFTLVAQAAAPNFAGTWTLDKSKSQGLSQRVQGADSVQWVITQDAKQITIEEKVTGGQMGGGPGGPPPYAAGPGNEPPGPPAQGFAGNFGGRGGDAGDMPVFRRRRQGQNARRTFEADNDNTGAK